MATPRKKNKIRLQPARRPSSPMNMDRRNEGFAGGFAVVLVVSGGISISGDQGFCFAAFGNSVM
jgi:hypothetical protein